VIGIISIVLGVLGVLGGLFNAIGAAFSGWAMSVMPRDDAASRAMLEVMERWRPWQIGVGAALVLVAGLLLASGIGMLLRRRWSVRAAWAWIVLKMVVVTASAAVTGLQQRDQMTAMAQAGAPFPGGFAGAMGIFSALLYWLWGALYPGFLCVWLARGTIRRRVAAWK
jgi:uncharacterized membrane protein SirB2